MEFQGKGIPLSVEGFQKALDLLGLKTDAAALWAVLSVETLGFGFLNDRRPQILFERHVFHQQTKGRFDSKDPSISNATPGGYSGKEKEYDRLSKAISLDREAALNSASWGLGQLMGFNCKSAGFQSVEDMVVAMMHNEDAQLWGMANFIKKIGVDDELRNHNWAGFAKKYNGPAYQKHQYDSRLGSAYGRYKALLPDLDLRKAQAALKYLGYEIGPIDGLHGRRTEGALNEFQAKNNLPVNGDLDEATKNTLFSQAFPA
jgi:hypothetical protein